jgi:hypothetical protein
MDEVEKKVNAMIGESIMNEYKAFKNLVKHKERINRVFVATNTSTLAAQESRRKPQLLLLLAAHLDLRRLLEDHLQRKGMESMMELLLLLCVLRRLDLLNLVNESISQLRLFRVLNFMLPLALLDLAKRR